MLIVLVMTISMLPVTVLAAEPAIVAAWNFSGSGGKSALPRSAQPTSKFPNSTFSHYRDVWVDYESTNASIYTAGWGSADSTDKYWLIKTSTKGCGDLTLTFSAWGFSRSPKKFTLQYSFNNSVYYDIDTYELALNAKEFSFRLPKSAENVDELYIRFLADKSPDARSIVNESVISTSNSRIANVKITAATYDVYAPVPEPSVAGGTKVVSGTRIQFTSGMEGGVVYYERYANQWEPVPESGLTVSGDIGASVIFRVKTVKSGLADSGIRSVAYIIKKNYIHTPVYDPMSDQYFPSGGGTLDVERARAAADRTAVKVVGQLVYRFGNSNSTTTSIIQDVINNKLVSLQVYSDLSAFEIGDIVEITGIKSTYAGVPQIENVSSTRLYAGKNSVGGITEPVVFDNFTDLLNEKENYLSAVVLVKDVRLGAADADGNIILTDRNNQIMRITNAAVLPEDILPGETITVLAVLSRMNSVDQLRTGLQAVNGGRIIYEGEKDETPPVITVDSNLPSAQINEAYIISASATDNKGLAAVNPVVMNYQINSAGEKNVNMVYNSASRKWEYTIPASELAAVGEISFTVTAKDASGLTANSGQRTVMLENLSKLVGSSPRAGTSTGTDKTPEISVRLSNVDINDSVKFSLTTTTGKTAVADTPMTALAKGVYTFNNYSENLPDGEYKAAVSVVRQGETEATEFSWVFTIGEYGSSPENITKIANIHTANQGQKFTVEGIVTSDASGFSRDTAFFDCIYVQDNTAGINVFPVDGNIQAGQTVRLTGYVSSYNGERQLNVTGYTVEVTDSTVKALPAPIEVSSDDVNKGTYLGSLVSLAGTIERIEPATGTPESIYVKDFNGEIARVFVDGYITPEKTIAQLAVGQTINAVGLASHDTVGYRVRIRDRADIDCSNQGGSETLRVDSTSGACIYNPGTPVINGAVTLSIDENTLNDIIEMARDNSCKMIIVQPGTTSSYETATLNIGLDGVRSILERTGAYLVFRTSYGDLTLSAALLREFGNTAGNVLSLAFSKEDAVTYGIAVKGDEELLPMSRGLHVKISDVTGDLAIINDGTSEKIVAKSSVRDSNLAAVINSSGTINITNGTQVSFVDVPASFWGYDGISFFSTREIFRGVTADTFDTDGTMTRAMVVTAFHRIEQEAAFAGNHSFADVAADEYYTAAVAWAVDNEMVLGVGDNMFDPSGDMTRAQIATILYRYAQSYGINTEAAGSLADFIDIEDIPEWAIDAMRWAVGTGLINGYDTGEIRPNASATRAETAVLLFRFVEMVLHGKVS